MHNTLTQKISDMEQITIKGQPFAKLNKTRKIRKTLRDMRRVQDRFKSSKTRVQTKCPTCQRIRPRMLYLANPEEFEDKPFPKRCKNCSIAVEGVVCPIAGAEPIAELLKISPKDLII